MDLGRRRAPDKLAADLQDRIDRPALGRASCLGSQPLGLGVRLRKDSLGLVSSLLQHGQGGLVCLLLRCGDDRVRLLIGQRQPRLQLLPRPRDLGALPGQLLLQALFLRSALLHRPHHWAKQNVIQQSHEDQEVDDLEDDRRDVGEQVHLSAPREDSVKNRIGEYEGQHDE